MVFDDYNGKKERMLFEFGLFTKEEYNGCCGYEYLNVEDVVEVLKKLLKDKYISKNLKKILEK